MHLLLTMLYFELTRLPRKKYFYWWRCSVLSSAIVILLFSIDSFAFASGAELFSIFIFYISIVLLLLVPFSAESSVSSEKKNHTLPLLLVTDLTPTHILVGKFLCISFFYILCFVSCLPIALFYMSSGGISAYQVLLSFATICNFIFFATAMGLCVAVFSGKRSRSFWLAILYLFVSISLDTPELSMVSLLEEVIFREATQAFWLCNIIHFSITCLLLLFACKYLLFLVSKTPKTKIKIKKPNIRQRPPIKGNAVAWLDFYFLHKGSQSSFFFFVFLFSAPVFGFFFGMVAFFSTFWALARAFSREKSRRGVELLLCSDLTAGEIVDGKIKAIWDVNYRLWIPFFVFLIFILITAPFLFVIVLAFLLSLYSGLLYISLAAKTQQASLFNTMAFMVVWTIISIIVGNLLVDIDFVGSVLYPCFHIFMCYLFISKAKRDLHKYFLRALER